MMPPLPKKRKHKEADITPKVMQWFLEHYKEDCAIEVKVENGKMKTHQEVSLEQVRLGNFAYKIPDTGRRNPFDLIILKKAHAISVNCTGKVCTAVRKNDGFAWVFHV